MRGYTTKPDQGGDPIVPRSVQWRESLYGRKRSADRSDFYRRRFSQRLIYYFTSPSGRDYHSVLEPRRILESFAFAHRGRRAAPWFRGFSAAFAPRRESAHYPRFGGISFGICLGSLLFRQSSNLYHRAPLHASGLRQPRADSLVLALVRLRHTGFGRHRLIISCRRAFGMDY